MMVLPTVKFGVNSYNTLKVGYNIRVDDDVPNVTFDKKMPVTHKQLLCHSMPTVTFSEDGL